MNSFISEKVIEDILTADKSILAEILSVNASDLSFIARQKIVNSGKLDLIYLYKDEIVLIELKAVQFYKKIITQINDYEKDLLELQLQNKLINVKIKKVILVIGAYKKDFTDCVENEIALIVFKPENILSKYYENFKELSAFLKIKSGDFGVVRIGLIKNSLNYVAEGLNVKEIASLESKSEKTINNKFSIAINLNLLSKFKRSYFLTELGNQFVNFDDKIVDDRLNESQINLLSEFINSNPFYSQITFTIFSLIESVFILSKTAYPVHKEPLKDYFVKSVGKTETWRAPKARETATYIFSNYACELEYLMKIDNEFYLTPKGINAVLLMQLNRSIKLIESRK
jgi:ribosomal protein L25 (general stress protein Ctc)